MRAQMKSEPRSVFKENLIPHPLFKVFVCLHTYLPKVNIQIELSQVPVHVPTAKTLLSQAVIH